MLGKTIRLLSIYEKREKTFPNTYFLFIVYFTLVDDGAVQSVVALASIARSDDQQIL
jgi:hypothetical protein